MDSHRQDADGTHRLEGDATDGLYSGFKAAGSTASPWVPIGRMPMAHIAWKAMPRIARLRLVSMLTIRRAEADDLPDVLEILNHEIQEGTAHFGTEAMTQADIEQEFERADDYPWVVAFDGERVVGFARASPWKSRGAYRRTCEVGVYVRADQQGRGIGRRIYEVFIPTLRRNGFRTLLGGVALPNDASIRLHEKFGFAHVGTLPQVGWKHGAWRDVGYWALVLDDDSSLKDASTLPES